MKKNGFTLVEVLMTLGVISVVGMLVTPSLMQNGRNETNAARLSTAVSNFENGLSVGMAADNAEDLYHWNVWTNAANPGTFYGELTRFMTLSGHAELANIGASYSAVENDPIRPHKMSTTGGKDDDEADFNATQPYTALIAKNGAMYFITNKANTASDGESDEATVRAAGRTLYSKAADVIIDVNGETGPNIVGRDIFLFMLSNEGTLFPYGSQEVNGYDGNIHLWNADCQNGAISDPTTCTARVVESGYRIDY